MKLVWGTPEQNSMNVYQTSTEKQRKFEQNLIDFHWKFNRKAIELGLGHPKTESRCLSFKFENKSKEIGLGQTRAESVRVSMKFE